jgi:plastocyanin
MNRRLVAAVTSTVLVVGGVVLAHLGAQNADVREIRLVVRDMTYYSVAHAAEANPTLHLARGEKIRLVLTNEDPGYSHNLIAPVLGVSTPPLQQGKSQSIDVTVPDVPGLYSYRCGPHSEMMRGNIAIE